MFQCHFVYFTDMHDSEKKNDVAYIETNQLLYF